jgi:hypothetical protein
MTEPIESGQPREPGQQAPNTDQEAEWRAQQGRVRVAGLLLSDAWLRRTFEPLAEWWITAGYDLGRLAVIILLLHRVSNRDTAIITACLVLLHVHSDLRTRRLSLLLTMALQDLGRLRLQVDYLLETLPPKSGGEQVLNLFVPSTQPEEARSGVGHVERIGSIAVDRQRHGNLFGFVCSAIAAVDALWTLARFLL